MSYRDDPRWLDARKRLVAYTSDDESIDEAFARKCIAAYEMYLIQLGLEVPEALTAEQALVTYSLLLQKRKQEARAA
ncbi:hypothetical protein AB0N38_26445 [Micromonospora aurantiaca]|uniref:hypothetical protein n=1 Tax=Micromonospora aurantiaca (nom. illeg.) TaxID=47850 RepID=UPI003442A4CC